MPIKINGQTSGSVTLSAPNTGSDVTLSLPGSNLDLAAIPQANISNLVTDLASKLNIAGGKILQIVRATDSTPRSTTSTSYVDATLNVTITPQINTSAVLLLATGFVSNTWSTGDNGLSDFSITDNSNNEISGAQRYGIGSANLTRTGNVTVSHSLALFAYATPATDQAVTYKLRFRVGNANCQVQLRNNETTAQMFAFEVSA